MCYLQADPMLHSWDKRTPLHFAAQHRHPLVIRQLLLHPSLRQHPSSTMRTLQQQHLQAADSDQDQHIAEGGAASGLQTATQHTSCRQTSPGSQLPASAMHSAQTYSQSQSTSQQPGHSTPHMDSIQDAASSLQSLQSGIHYEPLVGAASGQCPVDGQPSGVQWADSGQTAEDELDCSAEAAEVLDYTGEDADAMDALLALTSDCSVQSPPKAHHPAGGPTASSSSCSPVARACLSSILCAIFCFLSA